jgi:hypothetical protein
MANYHVVKDRKSGKWKILKEKGQKASAYADTLESIIQGAV